MSPSSDSGLTPEAVQIAATLVPDPRHDVRLPSLALEVRKLLDDIRRDIVYADLYRRAEALATPMVLGFDVQLKNDGVASRFVLSPASLGKVDLAPGQLAMTKPSPRSEALMHRFGDLREVANWIEHRERAADGFYRSHDDDELRKAASAQVRRAAETQRRAKPSGPMTADAIDTRYGARMRAAEQLASLRFNDLSVQLRTMQPPQELCLLFLRGAARLRPDTAGSGDLEQWFAMVPAHMIARDPARFEWQITPLRPGDEGQFFMFDSLDAVASDTHALQLGALDPKETQAWLYSPPPRAPVAAGAARPPIESGPMLSEYETNEQGHPVRVVTQRITKERAAELAALRATKATATP